MRDGNSGNTMLSNNEFREPDTSDVSDATIRRFLLGQLHADEQAGFEAELLTSDRLEDRVRLNELAIADDYCRRSLTSAESDLFQQRFLLTQDRKQIVAVSRALNDRFAPEIKPVARWTAVFNLERPVSRYAFAAIILLVIFAAVWLRVKEPRLAKHLVPPPFRSKPKPTQTPQVAHHATSSTAPIHQEDTLPAPDHRAFSLMTLDARNTAGNPFELKLANPELDSVSIQIVLEKDLVGIYQAELWNSSGESLLNIDSLAAFDDGTLRLDVPVRLLSTSEYLISVSPKGDEQVRPSQKYYFRVSR